MLTNFLISLIDFVSGIIQDLFPSFSFAGEYMGSISSAMESMYTFLASVNCLLPLPDIFLIITIDLGIRLFKLILWVGNWTFDKILDLIPF